MLLTTVARLCSPRPPCIASKGGIRLLWESVNALSIQRGGNGATSVKPRELAVVHPSPPPPVSPLDISARSVLKGTLVSLPSQAAPDQSQEAHALAKYAAVRQLTLAPGETDSVSGRCSLASEQDSRVREFPPRPLTSCARSSGRPYPRCVLESRRSRPCRALSSDSSPKR